MSFIDRLKNSLAKTSSKLSGKLEEIFVKKKLDSTTLDELEEVLISADIDYQTTTLILNKLYQNNKFHKDVDLYQIKQSLAEIIAEILEHSEKGNLFKTSNDPQAYIFFGVNGNGKTTTIAKIGYSFKDLYKQKVLLAACDTFRAAATEQLEFWANKLKIDIVKAEKENEDPASVAYKSADKVIKENYQVLLVDTAGRLHNKQNLLSELEKIVRSVQKHNLNCKTIMVLDGTTGQNALSQIDSFAKSLNINGIIITKLDGTAKGGIVVSIANRYKIPILAVGTGETIEDIESFSAKNFASSLLNLNNI